MCKNEEKKNQRRSYALVGFVKKNTKLIRSNQDLREDLITEWRLNYRRETFDRKPDPQTRRFLPYVCPLLGEADRQNICRTMINAPPFSRPWDEIERRICSSYALHRKMGNHESIRSCCYSNFTTLRRICCYYWNEPRLGNDNSEINIVPHWREILAYVVNIDIWFSTEILDRLEITPINNNETGCIDEFKLTNNLFLECSVSIFFSSFESVFFFLHCILHTLYTCEYQMDTGEATKRSSLCIILRIVTK